jgi:hypothetical protein
MKWADQQKNKMVKIMAVRDSRYITWVFKN